MSEIIIKVQLDLSDAVKDFMASLMGGVTVPTPKQKDEQKSEQKAEPAPVVASAPTPVVAPDPTKVPATPDPTEVPATPAESVASISREDIRALVKRIRMAEKDSDINPSGMIAILHKYGAKSVSDIQEADFVKITEELTNYLNTEIKPF